MTVNEKLMMAGLFLSRFNKDGLSALGFSGYWEAYNALALAVGAPPKSINNYRDEFDPYFPNGRKGWASRPLRPTRKKMMDELSGLNLDQFATLIRRTFAEDGDIEDLQFKEDVKRKDVAAASSAFAKRLMTGCAAENYFEQHYQEVDRFRSYGIERKTYAGCGFDFKLTIQMQPQQFCAVEVKGLSSITGSIQLTDKEHYVAEELRERYFLYIVRDFVRHPSVLVIQDPLQSGMRFEAKTTVSSVTTWNSPITEDTVSFSLT